MRLARFECDPQRFAGTEQVLLADDIVERSRPQSLSEWRGIHDGEASSLLKYIRALGYGELELVARERRILFEVLEAQ